ncbi:thiamine pyrophosphate-dependent enzyme [Kitasatospora sp. NPDC052896]|uniref:thiamine pyrophosphate-dependent enzyme n=1 Tax=Kitasatospora sp. NPDC052896 TaxID=3364061 RepID=UPI0037C8B683
MTASRGSFARRWRDRHVGTAVAAGGDRRVVLITGEGSHQLTAQEISQFGRYGLRPVVFVLNNNGHLEEVPGQPWCLAGSAGPPAPAPAPVAGPIVW